MAQEFILIPQHMLDKIQLKLIQVKLLKLMAPNQEQVCSPQ